MDAHTLLGRVTETLSVRRAFGEPIEHNGIVVIPVAFVAGGGGGGEGPVPSAPAPAPSGPETVSDDGQSNADLRVGEAPKMGSGGGLGGVIVPLGVYVVKGDDVRWKPVLQPMHIALTALGLIRMLIKLRTRALSSAKKR
jgi:uncharacterized spore protein YtfJ